MALTPVERVRRYEERHPDRIAAYRASDHYKKLAAKRTAAYRERNPEKIKAYKQSDAGKASDKKYRDARGTHPMNKAGNDAYIRYRQSEKYKQTYTNGHLKRTYGITLTQYEKMLSDQGGVCKICHQECTWKKKVRFTSLFVDHDHETGKVRGLLCHKCNLAIAYMRESEANLLSAIKYLKESRLEHH